MLIECIEKCDILVIGAGIAGISAAIEAAKNGCSVILTSSSTIFSGSSFFKGTWGLGLIGPEDKMDEYDLEDSIIRVGCKMAEVEIVKTFVHNINKEINDLKKRGVKLIQAKNSDEKEFIPCFDHKKRNWNGLEAQSMKIIFKEELEKYKVKLYPYYQAIELIKCDEKVCGAIFAHNNDIFSIKSKAVILATGGYSGIFKNYLSTSDVMGIGHAMALRAGAKLINMEFMQTMIGFISPATKTVFNEKTFRFSLFTDYKGNDIFKGIKDCKKLLEQRSTHGPFTSAYMDKYIDLTIANAELKGGVYLNYSNKIKNNLPEFINTYFDWLKDKKGISKDDTINIGIFAHAANGGVKIESDASTNVQGLYACGEVTGGMHGADRIGGLSSANCIVFGKIAGNSATIYSKNNDICDKKVLLKLNNCTIDYNRKIEELRKIMSQNAMILRNEIGLNKAINFCIETIEEINKKTENSSDKDKIIQYYRLHSSFITAMSVLKSALLRKESRGSHYRSDYPYISKSEEKKIFIYEKNGDIKAVYEK